MRYGIMPFGQRGKSRRSALAGRYRRVRPTEAELERQGSKAIPFGECLTCGQRLWLSGFAIGSHEKSEKHNEARS